MNSKLSILREKANNLPYDPGVYIMMDVSGTVIYVGKAKKLKNRVSSYFRGAHEGKVEAMIEKIDDFNVIFVKSEFEALMLENALIKKYMPHYNILLKDDKGYPFIVLDTKNTWPKFEISSKKKGKTFGPYGGRSVSRDIIDSVGEVFKIPPCNKQFPQKRACINYSIGLCDGWCVNNNRDEYLKRIDQATMILEGNSAELVNELTEKMLKASDELNFEYAAMLRDRIKSIENLNNRQRVSSGWAERNLKRNETEDNNAVHLRKLKTLELIKDMLNIDKLPRRIESFDVSNLGDSGIVAAMVCFYDAKPLKSGYRKFRIKNIDIHDDYYSMNQAVYRRFKRYTDNDVKFSELPDLLLIDGGQNHAKVAQNALDDLNIVVPVFGMVKDDRHRTRALITPNGEEIGIASNQAVFSFIGTIQEETHRFAIEYQRSLRYENYGSDLDNIKGVGNSRKADLLKHFNSVKAIKEATYEDLCKVVPKNTAKAIREYYESNNRDSKRQKTKNT